MDKNSERPRWVRTMEASSFVNQLEPTIIGVLRSHQASIGIRIAATVITVLMMAAFGILFGNYPGIGCAGAVLLWIIALSWIWRGQVRSSRFGAAVVGTVLAWVLAVPFVSAVARFTYYVSGGRLVSAACLAATAMTIYFWTNYVTWKRTNRPVLDEENVILVFCPSCHYRLNGLRELRCPECGATFAIDELIRAQNYAGSTIQGHGPSGSGAAITGSRQ